MLNIIPQFISPGHCVISENKETFLLHVIFVVKFRQAVPGVIESMDVPHAVTLHQQLDKQELIKSEVMVTCTRI